MRLNVLGKMLDLIRLIEGALCLSFYLAFTSYRLALYFCNCHIPTLFNFFAFTLIYQFTLAIIPS